MSLHYLVKYLTSFELKVDNGVLFSVTLCKSVCAIYLHDYWYELLHVFNKTLRVCKFNQCANNMLLTNTLSYYAI